MREKPCTCKSHVYVITLYKNVFSSAGSSGMTVGAGARDHASSSMQKEVGVSPLPAVSRRRRRALECVCMCVCNFGGIRAPPNPKQRGGTR